MFLQISEALVEQEYDENHFTVAISLPTSLTLRNHSIALYLMSKIDDFDEEDIIPIKQVKIL